MNIGKSVINVFGHPLTSLSSQSDDCESERVAEGKGGWKNIFFQKRELYELKMLMVCGGSIARDESPRNKIQSTNNSKRV